MEPSEEKEEDGGGGCCMCGDVGFSDQLLRCPGCRTRLQHTYCSRMYPDIEMKRWQCEWCLHKDHKHQQQKQQKQQQQRHSTIKTTKLKKRHRDKGDTVEEREITGAGTHNDTVTAKKLHLQKKESSSSMPSVHSRNGDQWRKPGCSSSSSKVVGRRYKLLADMLC